MPTKRCSWGICNSDNRYSHKPHMTGVRFFPFPKPWIDLEKCKAWIKACGRPYEQLNTSKINKYNYVCSKHFENGYPTESHPNPVNADPFTTRKSTQKRKPPKQRVTDGPSTKKVKKSLFIDEIPSTSTMSTICMSTEITEENTIYNITEETMHTNCTQTSPIKSCLKQENTLFEQPLIKCDNCGHNKRLSKLELKKISKCSFLHKIQESDATCFHYSGISSVILLINVFLWLEPYAQKIKLWDGKKKFESTGRSSARKRKALTLFEEFCLTLVRIRRGYDVVLLSHLFGIAKSHVCRILPSWINFLAKCLSPLIKWPSKEIVRQNLPESFKNFPTTRVIIDCTEIYVEKAFRPAAQKATWSSYKHANTFKLLVGIMPSGCITFLSKLYSGSISDAAIVEQSKIINLIEEGDDIMADRGFNIRHLLLPKKASLNIPSFSKGKRLSLKAIKRSRRIANVRIHVERAIGRMKTFRILTGIIPIKLRFQLNQIITIIGALCNLQDRLA